MGSGERGKGRPRPASRQPQSRRIAAQAHKNGRSADLVVGPVHITLTWPEIERLKSQLADLQQP